MADLSQQGKVIEANSACIPNNIAARAFRMSTENKNLLAAKGAMYVGTGEYETVTVATATGEVSYTIYKTEAIEPPKTDGTYALQCIVVDGEVSDLPHWVKI